VIEDELKQSVVVVNQPGASGAIGKKNAWEAPRDGYTWTAGAPKQLGTYKLLGQWDTWIDDWQLYNTVTNVPLVSVNPNSPYKTMNRLHRRDEGRRRDHRHRRRRLVGPCRAEALKGCGRRRLQARHLRRRQPGGGGHRGRRGAGHHAARLRAGRHGRGKRLRPLAVLSDQPLEIEGYGKIPPVTDFIPGKLPILSTTFGIFLPKQGTPPEVIETLNRIWATRSLRTPSCAATRSNGRAVHAGAGQAARDKVWPEIQADAWSFHAAGRATVSPETLNIPRSPELDARVSTPHRDGVTVFSPTWTAMPAERRARPVVRHPVDGLVRGRRRRVLAHAAAGPPGRAPDERAGADTGPDRPRAGRPGTGAAGAQRAGQRPGSGRGRGGCPGRCLWPRALLALALVPGLRSGAARAAAVQWATGLFVFAFIGRLLLRARAAAAHLAVALAMAVGGGQRQPAVRAVVPRAAAMRR
jgi:hypothetical protein